MNFLWKFYLLGDAVRQGSSLLSYNWIWSINGIFSHYTDQIIASNFDFSLKRATTLHDTSYFSAGSLFLRFLIAFCECERNGFVLPFVAATSSLLLRRHNTSPQLQIRLYTKLKDARRKVLSRVLVRASISISLSQYLKFDMDIKATNLIPTEFPFYCYGTSQRVAHFQLCVRWRQHH